jgi:hypothetical protein
MTRARGNGDIPDFGARRGRRTRVRRDARLAPFVLLAALGTMGAARAAAPRAIEDVRFV